MSLPRYRLFVKRPFDQFSSSEPPLGTVACLTKNVSLDPSLCVTSDSCSGALLAQDKPITVVYCACTTV